MKWVIKGDGVTEVAGGRSCEALEKEVTNQSRKEMNDIISHT